VDINFFRGLYGYLLKSRTQTADDSNGIDGLRLGSHFRLSQVIENCPGMEGGIPREYRNE
jgi:hypothetical protein